MKKCPNCGASMDADVNFCTNCGTKLIEENINTSVEKTTRVEPVFQTPAQPQRMRSTSDRSVKMHNYWQWLVASWKRPTGEQSAEKWYGIATILGEILLFVLGISVALNGSISGIFGSTGGSFTTQVLFELFLFLALAGLGKIVGVMFGRIFIFQTKTDIYTLINKIAQISGINAIIIVVAFVCCILGANNYRFAVLLAIIALFIFDFACILFTVKGQNEKRDSFYGLLISVGISLLIVLILIGIFGNALKDQIQSLISSAFRF